MREVAFDLAPKVLGLLGLCGGVNASGNQTEEASSLVAGSVRREGRAVATNFAEGLLAAKTIAQEIMSCVCAMTPDPKPLHLAVPQDAPRFEPIDSGLSDLALHRFPLLSNCFQLLSAPRVR